IGLAKPDAEEGLFRLPAPAVGQLLRIRKRAEEALDHAVLAADVERRAHVARGIGPADAHAITGGKGDVHDGPAWRASTSASLRPSSSVVKTPFCSRLFVIETIQRS